MENENNYKIPEFPEQTIEESYLPPCDKISKWANTVRPKYIKQYGENADLFLSRDAWKLYEE